MDAADLGRAIGAALTLAPWTVRNYLAFGRWIPVKANLAYELYQSQCLQRDGLFQAGTFGSHPYCSPGWERQEYRRLGEMAFLDNKRETFWKSVAADPWDFGERVASRFVGATVWYTSHNRADVRERPWATRFSRLAHPLPFLGLLILAYSAFVLPLHPAQWTVMGIYGLYLLPYPCKASRRSDRPPRWSQDRPVRYVATTERVRLTERKLGQERTDCD
jgi:hypothetical protein